MKMRLARGATRGVFRQNAFSVLSAADFDSHVLCMVTLHDDWRSPRAESRAQGLRHYWVLTVSFAVCVDAPTQFSERVENQ